METAVTIKVLSMLDDEGKPLPFREVERMLIQLAVRFYNGDKGKAAASLGMGRMTVFRKMKQYEKAGLQPPEWTGPKNFEKQCVIILQGDRPVQVFGPVATKKLRQVF
jgi:hypothetical protein